MKNGKPVMQVAEGTGPTLYSKLIFSKKTDKFVSKFFDQQDNPLDPYDLIGKYCYTHAAVKIESIFIGSKISLQVKLYEAVVEPIQTGTKRLLSRPAANAMLSPSSINPMTQADGDDDSGSESDGSIDEPPEPKVVKKVVRRVVKK